MSAQIFFNASFTYRLNVLAEAAIDSGEQAFGELIGGSIREIRVLRIIQDHPGIGFAEIVRATRLERSLVSRLIQSLLKSELIERRGTPDDARRYRLFATARGKDTRDRADAITRAFETLILAPLSTAEAEALRDTLDRLAAWVGSEDYAREVALLRSRLVASASPADAGAPMGRP